MATRPVNQTLLHLAGPLVTGVVFLLVALVSAGFTCFLRVNGRTTTGRVVGLVRQESSVGAADDTPQTIVVYAPVFVFTTAGGREVTVRSRAGSNPAAYEVGEPVRVLYREGDPGGAMIQTFGQMWGLACGFGAAGLLLSGVSWVLMAWGRSRIRRGLPTTNDPWTQRWAARGMRTPF